MDEGKTRRLIMTPKTLIIVGLILQTCSARIHNLKLENEDRSQIDLSTFGFIQGGYLAVKIKEFSVGEGRKPQDGMYGFTLDKTVSTGISPYLEGKQEACILDDNSIKNDDSVSVIFFRMDFDTQSLRINHKGDDLKHLNISLLTEEQFTLLQRQRRSIDVLSDTYLLKSRAKRGANDTPKDKHDGNVKKKENEKTKVTIKPPGTSKVTIKPPATSKVTTKPPATSIVSIKPPATSIVSIKPPATSINDSLGIEQDQKKGVSPNDIRKETAIKVQNKTSNKSAPISGSKPGDFDLKLVNDSIPMERDNKGRFTAHFLVTINTVEEEGLYNLFFHNCPTNNIHTIVNLSVSITENNNGNYLSAGEMPLPILYMALSCIYLLTGGYWFYVLRSSESGTVFKIHYLMLVLVFVKAIALFFHSLNFYFIEKEGHHEEAFAILYYISHLTKGALLFITIVLIGAGWAFVKHILSDRDKKIFIIVIPLQVLANVAQIIIEETEEGQSQYTTWKEVFILVDLLCCGAILFPVVWSIRHLQDASTTDGKAAINLAKLKIFRHFYIMIVCYIYFTRIIVYLLKITVPFQYEWLDELFREIATFIFFVVTGYKFRPASNNPYLQLSTDSDDEVEMDEVLTKSGALDDVVRVNVKSNNENSASVPSKRESSHDYD